MKKLIGIFALIVACVGVEALLAPMPQAYGNGNGPRCSGHKYCTIEPDGEIPDCGPCRYWEFCGPQCGCRSIPGCKTGSYTATVVNPSSTATITSSATSGARPGNR